MFVLVNPKLGKIWSNTLTNKKMIKVLFKSEELLIATDSESNLKKYRPPKNGATPLEALREWDII